MRREISSTRWGRLFFDEALMGRIREVWLDRPPPKHYKTAKYIKKTVFPDGKETKYYICDVYTTR